MPTISPSAPAAFLGMTNRVLASRDTTDGSLSVVEIVIGPGVGAPPHTNQREALTWYVLEGELTFFEGGTPVTRRAGELIFMPPDDVHTFLNQTDRDARALMICTPGGFEGFLVDVAEVLPDEAPDGPPPAEGVAAMQAVGDRYGLTLHVDQ
jgi:quercetin dioxygenase-like cupin family protein